MFKHPPNRSFPNFRRLACSLVLNSIRSRFGVSDNPGPVEIVLSVVKEQRVETAAAENDGAKLAHGSGVIVARRSKDLPKSADNAIRPSISPTERQSQSLASPGRTRLRVRVEYSPSFSGTAFATPSAALVASTNERNEAHYRRRSAGSIN